MASIDRPRTDADAAGAPADGIAEATGVARSSAALAARGGYAEREVQKVVNEWEKRKE